MTREELEHAIRAAGDVANDDELWVFGSQAILGQYADAPEELRMSAEVDVAPVNKEGKTIDIDANLGELSPFHEAFGFYIHGISIEAAVLPKGWERRAKKVCNANTGGKTGLCLEAHDLAVSQIGGVQAQRPGFRARFADRRTRVGEDAATAHRSADGQDASTRNSPREDARVGERARQGSRKGVAAPATLTSRSGSH